MSGQKTVPNIFINQSHIGGFSDLNSLNEAGVLKGLIANACRKEGQGSVDILANKINGLIQTNEIVIFSKSWCPYCQKVSFM